MAIIRIDGRYVVKSSLTILLFRITVRTMPSFGSPEIRYVWDLFLTPIVAYSHSCILAASVVQCTGSELSGLSSIYSLVLSLRHIGQEWGQLSLPGMTGKDKMLTG